MDEYMAKAFRESTAVSTVKGRSCHMIKVGAKRRRSKAEIKVEQMMENASQAEM